MMMTLGSLRVEPMKMGSRAYSPAHVMRQQLPAGTLLSLQAAVAVSNQQTSQLFLLLLLLLLLLPLLPLLRLCLDARQLLLGTLNSPT
jgi:hypothetical protein